MRANRNRLSLMADHSIMRTTKRPLLADIERTYYISYYISAIHLSRTARQ